MTPEFHAEDALRKLRRAFGVLIALLFCFGIFLTVFIIRGEQTRTVVNASPCVKNPGSKACAELREDVLRNEPLRLACIPIERVLGREPERCKNRDTGVSIPDREAKGEHPDSRSQKSQSAKGGGGSSGSSPGSQPTPPPSGGGGNPAPPDTPDPPVSSPPKPLRPALDNLTDTVEDTVDSTCDTASGIGVGVC